MEKAGESGRDIRDQKASQESRKLVTDASVVFKLGDSLEKAHLQLLSSFLSSQPFSPRLLPSTTSSTSFTLVSSFPRHWEYPRSVTVPRTPPNGPSLVEHRTTDTRCLPPGKKKEKHNA
jgi:hypothetical protein